jgi:hypothetical protein
MQRGQSQLELFQLERELSHERMIADVTLPTTCLTPGGSIRECRECWECHPELWSRFLTRANCVRHNR